MKMKKYIFFTTEGYTFQPNSLSSEPDIENLQVIGFSSGSNQEEAYNNLIKTNDYLLETNFQKTFCYQLNDNYEDTKEYYYLQQ